MEVSVLPQVTTTNNPAVRKMNHGRHHGRPSGFTNIYGFYSEADSHRNLR